MVVVVVVALELLVRAAPRECHLFDKGGPFLLSSAAGENRGGPNPALWGSACQDQEEEEEEKEEEEEEEEEEKEEEEE